MTRDRTSLWSNTDFLKLWGGETVSLFGSQVTALAMPLAAAIALHATAGQMGILRAASFAPFLLLTLLVGTWVDHRRRRPMLIAANLGRAVCISLVPLTALIGVLRIEYLYVAAFIAGSLTVIFDVAYLSFLPSLVGRGQLVEANSKLQVSASAAEIGGPGVAGFLVEVLRAPFALLADAASFLLSVLSLMLIRVPEPEPVRQEEEPRKLRRQIVEGLRLVFGNRYLRAIAAEAATFNMLEAWIMALIVLFATRELGMSPGLLGLAIGIGSVGALLGSLIAGYAEKKLGLGRTIITSEIIGCSAPLAIPFLVGPASVAAWWLGAVFFLEGLGIAVSNVHVVSLRQAITPDRFLGRMNASYRFLGYGAIPIGALLGGFSGDTIGLRPALSIGAIALLLAPLWVLFSPVRRLKRLPHGEGGLEEEARWVPATESAAHSKLGSIRCTSARPKDR